MKLFFIEFHTSGNFSQRIYRVNSNSIDFISEHIHKKIYCLLIIPNRPRLVNARYKIFQKNNSNLFCKTRVMTAQLANTVDGSHSYLVKFIFQSMNKCTGSTV